ncbi:MAG: hypothetical protein E6Q41_00725 [Cyclobacteriaceae bacterium]|jgi:hypothetical protein|nr:MAG: hypothetical protein E6Q41_00725 [Cyclobacteriaceae bacterium]HNA00980.1 hypothetical protein [Ferruginibacter sp.]HNJ29212.1 hypothetical protein [Ferruginibacter sp.]HNJ95599.1 hypothetical protein [Ferruginibacter sp.]HNN70043.1 hypothetical protein [Ferruginibacter sp.]
MRTVASLFLFVCLISLTGCFEIVEQLFLKTDGSGDFQMVLNLSKSRTRLNSIMKMKTINGHDVPSKEDIRYRLSEIEKTVSKTAGISNVKTSIDFDNFIASINCSFKNVAALNNAVKNIYLKENAGKKAPEKIYEYNAGVFQRWNKYSFKDDYTKLSNADKEVFATANYTAIFKFESAVSAASNKETRIAPSKKAVMLKLNTLDVITEKKSIENKINLTNR